MHCRLSYAACVIISRVGIPWKFADAILTQFTIPARELREQNFQKFSQGEMCIILPAKLAKQICIIILEKTLFFCSIGSRDEEINTRAGEAAEAICLKYICQQSLPPLPTSPLQQAILQKKFG